MNADSSQLDNVEPRPPEKGSPVSPESPDADTKLQQHREQTLWTYIANLVLGLWLLTSPAVVDYRDVALARSDFTSGALIVILGVIALYPRGDFWGRWGICLVGIWLMFAPLLFWAPTAFVYANDTLVGALAFGFAVLAPGIPGKAHFVAMAQPGPEIPPGWSYNPSSWWQRGPIIVLGVASFLITRYLTAYQLDHVSSVWDPFFNPGTAAVLTSDVSKAFPVPDAGLGSFSYLVDGLSGVMGSTRRWRAMPWLVLTFGVLVVPLGITSIALVIMQPIVVGAWCTPCLLTALFMLVMIPLALDEVWAMVQFLRQVRRDGRSVWRTFRVGGTIGGGSPDTRSPDFTGLYPSSVPPMVRGVTVPWNLLLSALIGFWLMAAPAILAASGAASTSDFLIGPLVAVVAVIAMAEIARALRFVNILFGIWLVVTPWLLTGTTTGSIASDIIAGILLIALSLPRGAVRERYGGWQRYIV